VRRIIEYGRQRHIDVIPCLELYGHLHDLFRVERYAELAALPHGGEFNPRNPKVMALLTDWADELANLFPSPFVHIGFDETWQIEMAARKEGIGTTPSKLFVQQLNAVASLFQQRGKRVMAWGDIIKKYPEIFSQLPPGLIDVAWEYDPKANYGDWLDPLLARNIPHIIATAVSNWREVITDFEYTFSDIDNFIHAGRESKALGLMNTVWSDSSQSLMRAAWPAIAYGAIAAWQSSPLNRSTYFKDYSLLMYREPVATEVALALDRLSRSELQLQKAVGQETMHVFWDDPFEPDTLKKLAEHREDLRQTRLLAEEAQEHFFRALKMKGDPATLNSLLIGSRMLDYAGLKFLTAVEAADRWREMGPKIQTADWWNRFESEWAYQSHGRPADLMDQITELRKIYRACWLAEYTDYRLDSTLGRWDAEYDYWRKAQANFRAFSRKLHDGELLPPLEKVIQGQWEESGAE
jgi:hexosaminidase